ncbi:LysR substrate-binding domain-containing protein [Micromonospora sp. NPDC047620]|uniref:LysR substrate-binding domain-containing protein n=1 Tax=Micromonospora sp. NPDC047620 TaxID=3364251 RepID=UPI0037159979
MELRDIEIFLTLAEELHFGRTATRLHVSQARISQSIAKQERRVGAALFERTSRRVTLTPIGARLRDDLVVSYQGILTAIDTATTTARGMHGTLTLGTMGALAQAVADVTDLFRARHPHCELRFREVHVADPFTPLRTGEVDVALLWTPVTEPDLTVGPVLRADPIMLMVADDHPLARQGEASMEDLGDYLVARTATPIPRYWEEALVPFHTPTGREVRRGPTVATWQEVLTVVAAGTVVQPVQVEASRYYPWPGITYLPVRDAPTCSWALVWRTAAHTALIAALAQAAHDRRPAPNSNLSGPAQSQ